MDPVSSNHATSPDREQSFPLAAADRQSLRLLTYNIQAGIATSRYHHYLTHSWRHVLPCPKRRDNLDRIGHLIQHFDIVGLQETDAGSLRSGYINITEYLANRARFPYWYDQTNRDFGMFAQHSMGVLSRFRATDISEHRLPGPIPGRGALMVSYGDGPTRLVLLLLHLALGRRARERQIAFVAEIAREFSHVIVMGDLNCRAESPELAPLISRAGLREPVQDLHTFPSWRPIRNIDHILVSPTIQVRSVSVLNYPLSDHLPIAMEVAVPGRFAAAPSEHPRWEPHSLAIAS